jgi:hypothetical protein
LLPETGFAFAQSDSEASLADSHLDSLTLSISLSIEDDVGRKLEKLVDWLGEGHASISEEGLAQLQVLSQLGKAGAQVSRTRLQCFLSVTIQCRQQP